MAQLDRVTARALTESGYFPLSEYIGFFGDEIAAEPEPVQKHLKAGNRRTRSWTARRDLHRKRRRIHKRPRLAS